MNCFYHPQIVAVALCKNCNKGLCTECVAALENGVACKGRCEKQVQAVNLIFQRDKGSTPYLVTAAFTFLGGIGSLIEGLITVKMNFDSVGMGILLMAVGGCFYRMAIRTRNLQ
jgi:hypothetical protein